jgi:hypothetical protein
MPNNFIQGLILGLSAVKILEMMCRVVLRFIYFIVPLILLCFQNEKVLYGPACQAMQEIRPSAAFGLQVQVQKSKGLHDVLGLQQA